MTATFWLVYVSGNRSNVIALFRNEVDANAYAAPNPWTVEEARIEVPFISLEEHFVTPM